MAGGPCVPAPSMTETRLAASALAALLLGTCIYLFDRDWGSAMFLSPVAGWQPARNALFGPLGASLPSFLHAYAFTVLLLVALWPWPRAGAWAAFGWFALAAGLEILQVPAAGAAILGPPAPVATPVLHEIARYAAMGEFDPADLWATALGCGAALFVTNGFGRRLP